MFSSCLAKQRHIFDQFAACCDKEARYQKIIDLGRQLPPLDAKYKTNDYLVKGCQSAMYLHASIEEGKMQFLAGSDALVSAGLAAVLIAVYSGETPETVLKCPPDYLDGLGISASLTPSRANGLHSIHLRMKQESLKWLMRNQTLIK